MACLVVAACGKTPGNAHPQTDAPPSDVPANRMLVAITLSTPPAQIRVGDRFDLTATAMYDDQSSADVTTTATWSSSTLTAGVIAGHVTVVDSGQATITAAIGDVAGTTSFTAQPHVLIATNWNNNSVVTFAIDANGAVEPIRTIYGPSTQLAIPGGLWVANDEIYVANSGSPTSITVYPAMANGNVAPTRSITGAATMLADVRGVTVFNGEIYTSMGSGALAVFPQNANGNVAPTRTITNGGGGNLSLQVVNNELFTNSCDGNAVNVFPATASGNALPTRTITGFGGCPSALYATATELFVANLYDQTVRVYPIDASGAATPLRSINGGFANPGRPAVSNGELYVPNYAVDTITVYPSGADGTTLPTRTIETNESRTSLAGPVAVFIY